MLLIMVSAKIFSPGKTGYICAVGKKPEQQVLDNFSYKAVKRK